MEYLPFKKWETPVKQNNKVPAGKWHITITENDQRFYNAMRDCGAEGVFQFSTKYEGQTVKTIRQFDPSKTIDEVANLITKTSEKTGRQTYMSKDMSVYVTNNTFYPTSSLRRKGIRIENRVSQLVSMGFDIDCHTENSNPQLPATICARLQDLMDFDTIPDGFIVNTGRGAAIWLFLTPANPNDHVSKALYKEVHKRIRAILTEEVASWGVKFADVSVDNSVQGINHIMRLPATYNPKAGRFCHVEYAPPAEYVYHDLKTLAGCSKEEAKSETVSSSANSVEPKATAEPAATPEPRKELTLTKLDVKEPNNIAVNGYLELPTVDGPYWQIVEDRLSSKNLEVYHKDGEENWTTAIFSGHTVYDYVADDGSLQKCIISGYEVFDLNNASDEIEYPNDTTQLRKETTCERIYIYNNQDEYDAAVKNREEGQAILNGEEVAPERCVILNGSIVPNLQYEVGDDGKIRISMRDLANAYSSKTIYIEENHILYVPMVYQYTAKFPTKDTPQSVLDNLNISEVVNPDDDTFTYTSTISMDLWNDTFELPQDDTYMMPIEHISRILGWEFWTGDNVLKIVSDELDDTNPDNFVIDTTVREETCYDVGTGEEIACD